MTFTALFPIKVAHYFNAPGGNSFMEKFFFFLFSYVPSLALISSSSA
jgi:hypothetical protein